MSTVTAKAQTTGENIKCSDPLVLPTLAAPQSVKDLWSRHGHPHTTSRYSNPSLTNLAALTRYNGATLKGQDAFLYPVSCDQRTPYASMSWDEFDIITEKIAYVYAIALNDALSKAKEDTKQPTVALLGQGMSIDYFCTQIALQKLGVRVLLLAESNTAAALQRLLDVCDASAGVLDGKHGGAETAGLLRIDMVSLSDVRLNAISDVDCKREVEHACFKCSGDVWEQHSFIIHSSGSTGMPKPIIHTNRSLMLIARMYRLFPDFEIMNWFLLFPLYHIAGISIALSSLPTGGIMSFPPLSWPPSSSAIFAAFRTLSEQGNPVDIFHCAPTLIENMCEHIIDNGGDFSPLSALKVVQPGGAALPTNVLEKLIANGVNLKTTYGSTEIGPTMRSLPHTISNTRCYAFRNLYPNNDKFKMEHLGDNIYECVVYKGYELAAELWPVGSEEPYRTGDLFVQDPPGSGYFVLQGRKDDLLVHTNGDNTNALPLQSDVQSSSKAIHKVLAVGHSRPCVSLLIEMYKDQDPETATASVWGAVKRVNEKYATHSRVSEDMIYILPPGRELPVTPKGNVKRKEALQTYAAEIESLYAQPKGLLPNAVRSSEALRDTIRAFLVETTTRLPEDIEDDSSFYNLGIDSQLALSLRSALQKQGIKISMGAIFEHPSIDRLTAYVERQRVIAPVMQDCPDTKSAVVERMISRFASEMASWPCASSTSPPLAKSHQETILLTGATGSLGTALLTSLVQSRKVAKIYLLVRGHDAKRRLRKSWLSRQLPEDILSSEKIHILDYSMGDMLLGLQIAEYAMLARECTMVIANAWKVDFNRSVEEFEADCLRGVLALIRLCCGGPKKTFVFTSSISTCLGKVSPSVVPEAPISEFSQTTEAALQTGYALSKYIIERLVTVPQFKALGIDVEMLRVGQLCGSTVTGHWNESEMWPIMFSSAVKIGSVPMLKAVSVDWVPVDVAGASIAELLLNRESDLSLRVSHIVNPKTLTWAELVSIWSDAAMDVNCRQLQRVSLKQWVADLNRRLQWGQNALEMPALKLVGFFEDMAEAEEESGHEISMKKFQTRGTELASPILAVCPAFCKEWTTKNVRSWRKTGFV